MTAQILSIRPQFHATSAASEASLPSTNVRTQPWARALILLGCSALGLTAGAHAQLSVVSVNPPIHAAGREPNAEILVEFDRAIAPASLSAFQVEGSNSGFIPGTLHLEGQDRHLRFVPTRPYLAGEIVSIGISHALQATDASFLRSMGWRSSFRVKTAASALVFTRLPAIDVRNGSTASTRVYGGAMVDFDGDDYVDMAIVNEDTSDVRVFRSLADGSAGFGPMLPPVPVDSTPSPNEAADVNGDGKVDLLTANTGSTTISVLIGNGDGTFQPRVDYAVGNGPRGMTLLDIDGDGDLDVVTANIGSNNCTYLVNNGNGTFGAPAPFEAGVNGEWAICSADMNNDGIVDFVVGGRSSYQVVVYLISPAGLFLSQVPVPCGGPVWGLAPGDMNGDGKMDITCANSFSDNGAILFGNGLGGLSAPQTVLAPAHALATDLGDLDGDGDLDWVLSGHIGQEWWLYTNNGVGGMTLSQIFPAVSNPSCAALFDFDQDRDLDIVLLDEIADLLIPLENGQTDASTFCFGDGAGVACPCGNVGLQGHGCDSSLVSGGGLLTASGLASSVNDTLQLFAGGLPPSGFGLFYQGTIPVASGQGALFGDGLRCVGGTVLRLGTRPIEGGIVRFGGGIVGDTPIHIGGAIPPLGGNYYYQMWYRNAVSFCTPATFNLTNGLRVRWTQ